MPEHQTELPIGTLDFFINECPHGEHSFSNADAEHLAKELGESIGSHLREIDERLVVQSTPWRRGCIIITVNIAILVTVAAGGSAGGIAVIMNYKKIRENVLLMASDVKSWFRPKHPKVSAAFYGDRIMEAKPTNEYRLEEARIRNDLIRWIAADGGAKEARLVKWLAKNKIAEDPADWLQSYKTPVSQLRDALSDLAKEEKK